MRIDHSRLSASEAETRDIGRSLGAMLRAGDVVLLEGALGAGKTTLVRAIAEGMAIDPAAVASPTFVVIHNYPNPRGPSADHPDLIHVDAYRLSGEGDLDTLGWDAVLNRVQGETPTAALAIEWPERLGPKFLAQADPVRLRLEHAGEETREFHFSFPESWRLRPGLSSLIQRHATTCPITGEPVPADSPTWPFVSQKARLADLNRWFTGNYTISRNMEQSDLEQSD